MIDPFVMAASSAPHILFLSQDKDAHAVYVAMDAAGMARDPTLGPWFDRLCHLSIGGAEDVPPRGAHDNAPLWKLAACIAGLGRERAPLARVFSAYQDVAPTCSFARWWLVDMLAPFCMALPVDAARHMLPPIDRDRMCAEDEIPYAKCLALGARPMLPDPMVPDAQARNAPVDPMPELPSGILAALQKALNEADARMTTARPAAALGGVRAGRIELQHGIKEFDYDVGALAGDDHLARSCRIESLEHPVARALDEWFRECATQIQTAQEALVGAGAARTVSVWNEARAGIEDALYRFYRLYRIKA